MLEPKQLTGLCVLGACPFSNWVSRVCRMFVSVCGAICSLLCGARAFYFGQRSSFDGKCLLSVRVSKGGACFLLCGARAFYFGQRVLFFFIGCLDRSFP